MLPTDNLELRLSRKLGEQLNFTFQFLRENSRTFWKSSLYIVGPSTLLTGVFMGYYLVGSVSRDVSDAFVDPGLSMALGLLFSMVTTVLIQGVANEYVRLYRESGPHTITVDDVWRAVRSRLGRLIGTTLAIVGIYMLGYLALFVMGLGGVFLIVLGILGLVVPAIWAVVPLLLTYAVRTHENLNISGSISRAFELVKGHWWMSFFVVFLLGLISWYTALICVLPTMLVAGIAGVFDQGDASSDLRVIFMVVIAIGNMISYMSAFLPAIGSGLNYFNLVEKHEAIGLLERIETIGSAEHQGNAFSAY